MKSRNRAYFPLLSSLISLAASAGILYYFFTATKYLAFLLTSLVILLPTLLLFLLLLLRKPRGRAAGADRPAAEAEPEGAAEKKKRLRALRALLSKVGTALTSFYRRAYLYLHLALAGGAFLAVSIYFFVMFRRMTSIYKLSFFYPILLLFLFVLCIILDKWCKHTETKEEFLAGMLHSARTVLAVSRTVLLLVMTANVLKLLNLYDLQKYLVYALLLLFCYSAVFLLLSYIVMGIKSTYSSLPRLIIPIPFVTGGAKELGVVSYLESETGITMRSLWSIKLVRHLLPYTVSLMILLFWLSTGLIQVESYEEGAVYRFGVLQERTLSPGLHLVLPMPIDRVEIYNTDTVSKMTIGYRATENSDNVWTEDHGDTEYLLLLGSGNELVSINLRVEYRIEDLSAYLTSCASPERLLESAAYELVTDHTISTNLDTLLFNDTEERAVFASDLKKDLTLRLADFSTGLEIVNVILESIHPPVAIADIYQQAISAEIDAERYILDAEGRAAAIKNEALAEYYKTVKAAEAESHKKEAAARAAVATFMASVEADRLHSGAYRYYKYLEAVQKAYGNANIIIVGEGVNRENIWFGSLNLAQQ